MTAEKKERKPRESSPWRVYRIEPGDGEDSATTLTLVKAMDFDTLTSATDYGSLAAAEKVCDQLAADEIGTRFVAAKCGRVHLAEEVRTVEVRKS